MNEIYLIELSDKLKTVSNFSKIAVELIACKKLGVESSELEFGFNENGKPYLKSHPDFHFNISHSKEKLAVAISDTPIGIDIEKLREPDFRVAKRFFTEREIGYVGNNPNRFFEIWTKKEAYLKFKGTGLKFPLSDFDVTKNTKIITFEKEGFLISLCSEESDFIIIELGENYVKKC